LRKLPSAECDAMFDDEEQQKRYEEFQQRRARYFNNDAPQEITEIVSKRFEPPAPQESTSVMGGETQAKWDNWCDARVERQIESLAEVVGSETARNEKKLEQRLLARIESPQEELTKIRSMVEGNVTPIDRARKDGTNG
jgi:hypothetical protein